MRARWRMATSSWRDLAGAHQGAVDPGEEPVPVVVVAGQDDGEGFTFLVCTRVIDSNISSRVPNPPGMITKAWLYLTNITLRTKK